MCRKITCEACKKPTWAGCGKHIEAALKGNLSQVKMDSFNNVMV